MGPLTSRALRIVAPGAMGPVVIEKTDMSEDMTNELQTIATQVFSSCKVHKDIASKIKMAFDAKYPPVDNKATSGVYHCIAGSNFAASITHETHCAAVLSCDNVKVLLFKS